MNQNFFLKFTQKGICFEDSKVKIQFEKPEFGKLQFVLKTAKWDSQKANGKIVRFENDKICQFQKESLRFAFAGQYISIDFVNLSALCQEIRDNVHKCISLEKIKIEFPEKIIIQNFQALFLSLDNNERSHVLQGILEENSRMLHDISTITLRSSGITSKNPFTYELFQAILKQNLTIFRLINLCDKVKNE